MNVVVGGAKIGLEWVEMDEWGSYHHDERKILLNAKLLDDADNFALTLKHEIRHAALAISGVSFGLTNEQEEQIVRCMDTIFDPAWDEILTKANRWTRRKSLGDGRRPKATR
jgi:hypothetical protein